MVSHTLNQEEMVRKYRERIRKQVEEELHERRSQNHVEETFSPPDKRTSLEKAIGIPPPQQQQQKQQEHIITKKAKEFDQAWRDVIHRGDCSLFDRIVHRDYYTENHGVRIDKDTSRRLLLGRKGKAVMGPFDIVYENTEFLCIQRYSRVNLYTWFTMVSGVTYKDGQVYTQLTVREPLDNDPSQQFDWVWEDYKSK